MRTFKLTLVLTAAALHCACGNTPDANRAAAPNSNQPPAAAQSLTPAPSPAGEIAAAGVTYKQVCARCHRAAGEGGVLEVEGVKLKIPSLIEGKAAKDTDRQLAKQIAEGGGGMPAFKSRLRPDQIDDLVRYIREDLQTYRFR